MRQHRRRDPRFGYTFRYHPRSDAHSKALCREILIDLIEASPVLREQARSGVVCYAINYRFTWPDSGRTKTLDLAIGRAREPVPPGTQDLIRQGPIRDVLVCCEAKTVMTEHSKSKPRIYDELSSSHQMVHSGRRDAVAAGITVVNIAERFASPLRQRSRRNIVWSLHRQPEAARSIIEHLRGLPVRDDVTGVGFDAYASVVVDCDNLGEVTLWTAPPAPQPGDLDHYETFVARVAQLYDSRFGS
jgi:hypothetical protein